VLTPSEPDQFKAAYTATILAVSEGFPHLSIAEIIDPPHAYFDAALARQVALHIMVNQLCWPKRRVVEELARSREALNRGLRTIDDRLEGAQFLGHYESIAARTCDLLSDARAEAA